MLSIVPRVVLPLVTPFTCHVTEPSLALLTVAVNCCVWFTVTVALAGEMATVTEVGASMVTWELAVWLVSALETAVTVTTAGDGTLAGAVYSPLLLMVPTVALPLVTPFTCQVTPVLVVLITVGVNCCVLPVVTVAVAG